MCRNRDTATHGIVQTSRIVASSEQMSLKNMLSPDFSFAAMVAFATPHKREW